MKLLVMLAMFTLAASPLRAQSQDHEAIEYARRLVIGQKSVVNTNGYVPDRATAIRITIAILIPIYGSRIENGEKPWKAELKGGVWTVVGTSHDKGEGGEAIVQLSKSTGAILFVTHTM